MPDYLKPDQRAQLLERLKAEGGGEPAPEDTASEPEAAPPAEDMAASAPVDSAAPQSAPVPAPDPNEALLSELGVSSVEDLVNRYKEVMGKTSQYKEMLTELLAFQQSLDNKQELDPGDPLNTVKEAVRQEMAPVYDKLQKDAKNKLVQEAWGKDAANMPDLTDLMPDITAFLSEHPDLSVNDDGLRRAYEGVRSKKYRSEKELLSDDKFVEKMASNDKVKDLVIKSYLAETARAGGEAPASIGNGGNVPLTGQKKAPTNFDQAKSGLLKMLGK